MYLGIDLGTSGVKIVILAENEQLIGQASSSLTISRLENLWSEQDPKHWWQATNFAMAQLKAEHGKALSDVKAIGLSGQMHGATLLDDNDHIIRPAILWNDGRSYTECAEIEQRITHSRDITGNIAMPGFTAPKLAWVKKNEPHLFDKIKKVLLPKDYLRLLMTGDYASDMSDSSGTLWLDVANRQWSDEMLTATDLDKSHMPELFEGTEVTGILRASVAKQWGVKQVPVAAGAGDNAAGAAGIGVINPNEAFLSLGTSGVFFVANKDYQSNTDGAVHTFCHCIPETWHQMSVILSAASCLTWVTKLTGAANEKALLDEVANEDFTQPCAVTFLPYLSGERTPHNNPDAKGVFFGLSHNSTRSTLGRAVLEGVAFAFADAQQVLLDGGTEIAQVSVIGGGARSQLWGKILASVLNQPLIYREGGEVGPAFGAARLARIAISKESPQSVCQPGKITKVIESDSAMSSYYQPQYQTYRKLYTSLKGYF
ncbi:xylulokinase [Colwellia sp. MB02u-10]|uniref:xylulokinase n=1 Tax=Colwellia sp. MB02u-10 TaxID=2759828 RepID=UPI0015F3EB00|nr:xylulokinase [Colwellia sp. MB02u-10]MBA6340912.1 xylulokinase [Colwellia sp. MB02u-10]